VPALVGRHNLANALAALLASRLLGATHAEALRALSEFQPLAHRMELVAKAGGVLYYDDSKGTNVGAVVAALDGFPRRVVLIAGGRDKGGDYAPLAAAMGRVGRAAVLIGEAADKIEASFRGVVSTRRAATLEEAVDTAAGLAQPGDAVVLSPACSSFDMFRDYAHRAQVFREAVDRLAAREGTPAVTLERHGAP
jgi:UDP-N-acetylmuramoylalanine--D-glutamate ligase